MTPMSGAPVLVMNPARRILKMPGVLCGGISTGSDKIRSGYGNGDCLYFDFEHLVFAVADGTERFPWASRDLLKRLWESLARSGVPDTVDGWRALLNSDIYAGQKYQHKTTFSCVAVRRDGEDVRLIIAHGGDSAVTVLNGATGAIRRQTGRDMNFAGRSKEIVDITAYPMADRDGRVLISSDGFDDVWRFCLHRSMFGGMQDLFAQCPVDGLCDMMHGILVENRGRFEYDDAGMILLDPHRMARIKGTAVMMGGTRPYEEKRYRSDYASETYDGWVPEGQWAGHEAVLNGAGIQVLRQGY